MLEAGQAASNDCARGSYFREMLAHLRQRHAGLFGELRVESLAVLFEAVQDFGHFGAPVVGGLALYQNAALPPGSVRDRTNRAMVNKD